MTAMENFSLDHPQLGRLTGRLVNRHHPDGQPVTEPVVHFRSIPYATIPARFKQSVILGHLPVNFDGRPRGDFTQYGAACPQVPQPTGRGSATGGFVPGERPITYDEETCLKLGISVPARHLSNQNGSSELKRLPVMVYVHGGGFVEDVLVVSIGYRLNWQGFIACYDLLEEARENGEPAFLYGLRDQRHGFDWIKRHIAGFGGDPDNITAFGESAGAVSLYMHACSDMPLFNRVILQSGSPNAIDTWTLEQSDECYHRLLSYLGVTGAMREERLRAIREVPISRLIDFIRENNVTTMKPFLGPESGFFPEQPFWSTQGDILANCPWLHEIMIGDDCGEGLGFAPLFQDISADRFITHVRTTLGEHPARRILAAYEIHDGIDEGRFWQNALTLAGNLIFSEPTHSTATAIAQAGRQRLYRWQF